MNEAKPNRSTEAAPKQRFGESLVSEGKITQQQLDLALRQQSKKGGLIGQILVELGFASGRVVAQQVAREAQVPFVDVTLQRAEAAALQRIPFFLARQFVALPLMLEAGLLTVAMANPSNIYAVDALQKESGLPIEVVAAPEGDIITLLDKYYSTTENIEVTIARAMEETDLAVTVVEKAVDLSATDDMDAPVIRLVSHILARAVDQGASDIHFEPEQRIMRIRTRIDGELFQDILIPKPMQSPVTTRLKILAELDVAETRLPQDGRATLRIRGKQINLRVSSLPTTHGENVVIRVLSSDPSLLRLQALGFAEDVYDQFNGMINRPYGVILVTGPTGSGKTTTLYATLNELPTMELSIFTLEDPVEYQMPVIRQTQIREDVGLTFAAGLRALLRQDPDVILVGETRDTETATLMVRAALTGHMVLSTLHTNDSAGAMPRLVDMGVEPYLLPASLIGIMAQRLVRVICPKCKQEMKSADKLFQQLGLRPTPGLPVKLYHGIGCAECRFSGFRGRQGIYELMVVNEKFHDPIVRRAGAPDFQRLARENGMRTMFEDGLAKAHQGVTTLAELLRVIPATE